MNILFLYLTAIVPTRGGVSRVTVCLADELEKRGHRVFYLSTTREHRDSEDPRRQHYLPDASNIGATENSDYYKRFLSDNEIDVVVFQAALKKFPWRKFEGHPPLVCALHVDPCFYESVIRDKLLRKSPGFFTRSVVVPLKTFLRRKKMASVYRWNYEQCDRFVVLSESYCSSFLGHLSKKELSSRVVSIPNPCSFVPVRAVGTKEKVLIWCGRLNLAQKRPDLMIEIWSKLEPEFPDWRLEVLGDGKDAEIIKKMSEEKNLSRIHFRGFVSPERYFETARYLCMTSSNEGFPMVLLESSAWGCVPIAFDAFPTSRDIIKDGETGFLVPPRDTGLYVEKLRGLMGGEGRDLADSCKDNAKAYRIETIVDRWSELFEALGVESGVGVRV